MIDPSDAFRLFGSALVACAAIDFVGYDGFNGSRDLLPQFHSRVVSSEHHVEQLSIKRLPQVRRTK